MYAQSFVNTDELLDRVQQDLATLIGNVKADKEAAKESRAKHDLYVANEMLKHLLPAYIKLDNCPRKFR